MITKDKDKLSFIMKRERHGWIKKNVEKIEICR